MLDMLVIELVSLKFCISCCISAGVLGMKKTSKGHKTERNHGRETEIGGHPPENKAHIHNTRDEKRNSRNLRHDEWTRSTVKQTSAPDAEEFLGKGFLPLLSSGDRGAQWAGWIKRYERNAKLCVERI